MSWAAQVTPFDGAGWAYNAAFAAGLGSGVGRLAVVAANGGGDQGHILTSDDGGTTWTDRGQVLLGQASSIAYAAAIGVFIATGLDGSSNPAAVTSADGITWSAPFNPFIVSINSIASNLVGDLIIAVDVSGGIWTSTDGTTFTSQPGSPYIGASIQQIAWVDPLGLWFATGATEVTASSPDGVTWSVLTTPLGLGSGNAVAFHALSSQLYLAGYDALGSFTIARSADGGSTWTIDTTPFDATGFVLSLCDAGTYLVAAGLTADATKVVGQTPGDGTWTAESTPLDGASEALGAVAVPDYNGVFVFGFDSPTFAVVIILGTFAATAPGAPNLTSAAPGNTTVDLAWTTPPNHGSAITGYNIYRGLSSGTETLLISLGVTNSFHDTGLTNGVEYFYEVTAVNSIGESAPSNERHATPTAAIPPALIRFRPPIYGRLVVTNLLTEVTTWLDRVHLGATITQNLNQPGTVEVSVRSNAPAVNRLHTDGDPLLAQSNRLIYVLFDERPPMAAPWVCRAAGIAMQPQDQADADVPTSHFVFYDPWQYLMARPAFTDTDGTLPLPSGFKFRATRGGVIVATLLLNTILSEFVGAFIDAGPDYGGTIHWNGVIEDTPIIDYTVQQGSSVGDNWNQLLAAGQDPDGGPGGLDIVLTPIYDPILRAGYTHELSVYNLAGTTKPYAPMAWGEFVRTSTTADREHDASPGSFINEANYYAGQGGPPVGVVTNPASITKYQPYWAQQFFPQQPSAIAVQAFAQQAITLTKQGKRTFTVAPDPLRASPPFQGYNLGDRIPQLASRSLRVPASGYQRVQTIPVQINPDGVTSVPALLTSPDWRGDDGT